MPVALSDRHAIFSKATQLNREFAMEKYTVSNDPNIYEAWPDVTLTPEGKLVCVFSECTHHKNRDYTRIMLCESADRGRTWSPKHPLTEGTANLDYYYNCARIGMLKDDRMYVIVDKVPRQISNGSGEKNTSAMAKNLIYFSDDFGATWQNPVLTPLKGIVPDRLLELDNGRWIISAHHHVEGNLVQFMHYSEDHGNSWSKKITVASKKGLNLCEVSILPVDNDTLVAFLRENSMLGYDCMKTISNDNGETWGEVINFPLPGCHRPVARYLNDGQIFITHRFVQGGKGWLGTWTQNFFGAFTDTASVLAETRNEAWTRIFPIDFDRSSKSDLGYSGHVQFPDGEIYVVNYIVDDAVDKGQIRGYSFYPEEFLLK